LRIKEDLIDPEKNRDNNQALKPKLKAVGFRGELKGKIVTGRAR
jgi:hypothetical protein